MRLGGNGSSVLGWSLLVVSPKGRFIHVPKEMPGGVWVDSDVDGCGSGWILRCWERKEWNGSGKGILFIVSKANGLR